MSKNTDPKNEATNNDPDNKNDKAADTSAVKYDVVFDDDDNALDLGALAATGQTDRAAGKSDASYDADSGNNGSADNDDTSDESHHAETNTIGDREESDSSVDKVGDDTNHHAAKQPAPAEKDDTSRVKAKKPNNEDTPTAGEKTTVDRAIPDSVATSNAQRVNETLGLAATEEDELITHEAKSATLEPATAVSTRLDRETIAEAEILLKPNPTFALDHVTFTNQKTGRNVLDNIDWGFFAGSLYAITGADDEQRRTLLAVASGFYRPDSGQVMVKSQSFLELETNEIRGHRIGLITQRYSLRNDLDALTNLTFTMRASGRTFLKPIPEVARDVLKYVDFDEAATGVKAADLRPVEQRRLAIARAICCEATVVLADDPVGGLEGDDRKAILDLLSRIAHARDPKRCVIVLAPNPAMNSYASDDSNPDGRTNADNQAGIDARAKAAANDLAESTSETDYETKADKIYSF